MDQTNFIGRSPRTGIGWRMIADRMSGGLIRRDDMAKAQAISDAVPRRDAPDERRAFNVSEPDHGPHD